MYRNPMLNVHLGGVIAYVPWGETLWALMPNAILPAPARWESGKDMLLARGTHIPFLLVDERYIVSGSTTGDIDAYFRNGKSRDCKVTAAIALLGEQLDFGFTGDSVEQSPDIKEFVPQMSIISPRHRYVSRQCLPGSDVFDPLKLSAAFQLKAGRLDVHQFYGQPLVREVGFGYVLPYLPSALLPREVWNRRVANKLLWSIPLREDQGQVEITSVLWEDPDVPTTYVLEVPDTGVLEIEIVHAEPEIPSLFLNDVILSGETAPLPDPDFEAFYPMSSANWQWLPWRVPVSRTGPAGKTEKTCSGGYFEGFA